MFSCVKRAVTWKTGHCCRGDAKKTGIKALLIICCLPWTASAVISACVLTALVPHVLAIATSEFPNVFTLQVWMIRFHPLVCFCFGDFSERNCQEIELGLTPTRRAIQAPIPLISILWHSELRSDRCLEPASTMQAPNSNGSVKSNNLPIPQKKKKKRLTELWAICSSSTEGSAFWGCN